MTDTARLERLLKLFFGFERPEIVGFRRAVAQFKTDLPAVLKGLREMIEAQHDDSDFHRQNNVAHELYELEATFFTGGLKKATLKGLEPYYAAIRAAAAQIGRWCSAGANCGATRSAGLGSTRAARIHD